MSGRIDIAGKTAFVTGAARGIGNGIARRLHGKGANVALVGLERELLDRLASELGERALAIEADVTDFAALEAAASATEARFGGIDVGVANAGISFTGTLASSPVEQVERTFAVNMLGVWRTDRALLPALTRSKGYLLNVSSLASAFHAPLMGPYSASKAAVEALSNVLRVELAPSGVSVGCAYLGFIETDLVREAFARPSAAMMSAKMPAFLRNPAPLAKALDALESGIERRAGRVWAPRWVGAAITLRTLFQPLSERRTLGDLDGLAAAMGAASADAELDSADPLLGVAVRRHPPA